MTENTSRQVKISYNEMSYIDSVTDALGNTTRYWTNELGQVIQKKDALETTILPTSDPNITDGDIVINDPLEDIFDLPSGSPKLDDIVMSENGAIKSVINIVRI